MGPIAAKVEEYSISEPSPLKLLKSYIRRLCLATLYVYGMSDNTPPTPQEIQAASEWELRQVNYVYWRVMKTARKRATRKTRGETDDERTYVDDIQRFDFTKVPEPLLDDVRFFMYLPGIPRKLIVLVELMKEVEEKEKEKILAHRSGYI
ncbi:hypothetical protein KIPB_009448 [Kipferlia bialata]|uniref:Uncharacterized protein n=1 Tax=Kipferlia bialata TaxID=797122 RepID=A0A9K3D3Y6_9EUKA|nr:hypothetical protein KIPB_009448 [Kipferlia bialata]|eukprot:g9448.t1